MASDVAECLAFLILIGLVVYAATHMGVCGDAMGLAAAIAGLQ